MRPTEIGEILQDEVVAPNFTARRHSVRETIWGAALDLFVEKGYDETTVDAVAQAAGISQRSFFRYFATKGDLMSYALVRYANELIAAIDGCPTGYSPGDVFRETVVRVAKDAVVHPRTGKFLIVVRGSAAAASAEMSGLAEAQSMVAEAFLRRFPEGVQAALTASVMAGVTVQLTGVMIRWCFEHRELDVSAALNRLLPALGSIFCTAQQTESAPGDTDRSL
jgi:AcrR family transcriptional regulator